MAKKSTKKDNGNGKGKAPQRQERKISRIDAFSMAFKELNDKGFTKEEIIKKADDIYVKHGGSSNLKEGHWYFNYFRKWLVSLQEAGITDVKGLTFNVNE